MKEGDQAGGLASGRGRWRRRAGKPQPRADNDTGEQIFGDLFFLGSQTGRKLPLFISKNCGF
jgi:hypothetical protein